MVCLLLAASRGAAVDYTREIRPLLAERCFSCHGTLRQQGGLRLDTAALMQRGGKSGPALVPGKPESSPLFLRISHPDPEERMPPQHEAQPFSTSQAETLRLWIADGAPAPTDEKPEADPRDHWAFRPRTRPSIPSTAPRGTNPIDAFLAREHARLQVVPLPEAPRPVLVRRLYLDLLGLPPSPEESAAALSDPKPDWYERLVDRLLDDPRRGERWARHWMDIWRYSDPWGLGDQHRNSQKHIWHWRDWIIESLNRDLPYDEMLRLMLAADESHPNDLDRLRATGFLARNYFLFNRNQWLDETVEHVGKAFLGITLNCAKCHDHKYDPFPQSDYYRFRAYFEPYHTRLDLLPGQPSLEQDALPVVFDRHPDTPTWRFIRGQESAPDKSHPIDPGVPAFLQPAAPAVQPVSLPVEAWQPERRPWVLDTHLAEAGRRLTDAGRTLAGIRARQPATPTDADLATVNVALQRFRSAQADLESIRRRAHAQQARWEDKPDSGIKAREALTAERKAATARGELHVAEAELAHLQAAPDRRDAAAKELASARGKRDQARADESGPIPEAPNFTPLIGAAWTATRFLDSTKDDPSTGFPATSTGRRSALAAWITHPDNPLTARVAVNHMWNRHLGAPLTPVVFDLGRKPGTPSLAPLIDWLASDLVEHHWSLRHVQRRILTSALYRRDSSLARADAATLERDPDNHAWWRRMPLRIEAQVIRDSLLAQAGLLDPARGGPPVPPSAQDGSRRRSLYFFHSNNERNLFLTTFDDALVKECYRRESSIVPQQSLALLNSRLVADTAPAIASRLAATLPRPGRQSDATPDDIAFLNHAFRTLLGFTPSRTELEACQSALRSWRGAAAATPVPDPDPARIRLVEALVNHADFVTLR